MTDIAFKRVLLKLSGEALEGKQSGGISPEMLDTVCAEIRDVVHLGVELGIVVGGGNLFRGIGDSARLMDRATADYMGMLATVMNALALQDNLERIGVACHVQSALDIPKLVEPFVRKNALEHLKQGRVVIFAAGTGNPYFSTDTAAALRAAEMHCDIFFKATKVPGVFSADPVKQPDAKKYEKLRYAQILDMNLKVMDLTAVSLCQENKLPILVFSMQEAGNIVKAVKGETVGTIVTAD